MGWVYVCMRAWAWMRKNVWKCMSVSLFVEERMRAIVRQTKRKTDHQWIQQKKEGINKQKEM